MGNAGLNHSRFVCLMSLGKSADEAKALLGLKAKEIESFNSLPDSNPQLTLDVSKSSTVRSGKYNVYLAGTNEVILINAANFYFIRDALDGEIKVIK